jgi:hypothetical protein
MAKPVHLYIQGNVEGRRSASSTSHTCFVTGLADLCIASLQLRTGLQLDANIRPCLRIGVFLVIDALVLHTIYLTGIKSRIFAPIPGPLSFPLHVMHQPFKSSSCRLLSVEGSAAGDRSRPSQGQQGPPLWQNFSKGLVVEMACTMELAACCEPNSGPKTETCDSEHGRFEGGVSFDVPCSL